MLYPKRSFQGDLGTLGHMDSRDLIEGEAELDEEEAEESYDEGDRAGGGRDRANGAAIQDSSEEEEDDDDEEAVREVRRFSGLICSQSRALY